MKTWEVFSEYGKLCNLSAMQIQELHTTYQEIFSEKAEQDFFDQCLDELIIGELLPEKLVGHYQENSLPKVYLLLVIGLYPYGLENYRQRKWPEDMFRKTATDVAIWVKDHEQNFGSIGLEWNIVNWERRIFSALTIRLGRLQCDWTYYLGGKRSAFRNPDNSELIISEESPGASWKCLLKPGDPVINIHIPADGPMDIEACRDSFRQMTRFFDQYQPEYHYQAIVCYSWFLDRQLQDILPATSNIVRFQQFGHVFDCDRKTDAIRRVFGKKGVTEGINAVPHRTELQRRLAKFINNGGQLKVGGIFILKEEIL